MSSLPVHPGTAIVVGGGAAGFFAAITCAEAAPGHRVVVLERGREPLAKVRISGGGRCNVTHADFDVRSFASRYPRGGQALLGPLRAFSARDTVAWFESRGVGLKAEPDGRMFPRTDSSQTVVDCLRQAAHKAGVEVRLGAHVEGVRGLVEGGFMVLGTSDRPPGEGPASPSWRGDCLLLATGGCRAVGAGHLPAALGHTLVPPVPSLFTFRIDVPWLHALSGVAVERASLHAPVAHRHEEGPVLITHWGLSGPAVLRLSAWGARAFSQADYRFALHVNWLPDRSADAVAGDLKNRRSKEPAKRVAQSPCPPLPARLWEQLVLAAGLPADLRWASLTRAQSHLLTQQLTRTELAVAGKSLNKDEFVTCGGVPLAEVDLKTMESRLYPGLYLAGELLDIDGLTGGFNFQAAWTTGYLAGRAMAQRLTTGRRTSLR